MSLFLLLLFPFTVTGQDFYVRDGAEVTLPCGSLIPSQDKCQYTTWIVHHVNKISAEELVAHGKISPDEFAQANAARLSVTADCSLVIKKVTAEDVGRYFCQQFVSGQQQGSDAEVYLSLIQMTEQQQNHQLKLQCSVSTYEQCRQTVTWLCGEERLDQSSSDIQISVSPCNTTVTLQKNHCDKERLKCQVSDGTGKVQTFDFTPLSSGGTTTTLASTAPFIAVGVVSAALLITVAVLIVYCKRAKGNKTATEDNVGLTLISDAEGGVKQSGPAGSQDKADPDTLTYASIVHSEKKDKKARKAKVQCTDDGDDAVTYATVRPSSASAVASTDLNLYATVNKPAK
ncbi:uncharacterized protein LOC115356595 [Myripristis murdjan]|uniref:uncharacterized protein LOC115356595 n=1 Tax=Myripristis murdjan TaxID=586833 RepID=UPI001175E785|nr:uncharacterized protein LOC115356595 [Myripristis murdjan]